MSKASRRYLRTIILGVAAMGSLIWAAMDQFGISREEVLGLFYNTLAAMAVLIATAAVLTIVWIGLRKLLLRIKR
ncbi:MAG: hypothetical protein ACI9JM_002746 [Halioglobus sp.]|jgi:hypothetical protein